MTFFDNLKNKLFKEENSGKGKDSQPAEKSKNLQNKIKGLFAKKPDEVEQAQIADYYKATSLKPENQD